MHDPRDAGCAGGARRFAPIIPYDISCGRLSRVNARSALFDLYGDHLRERGGRAPVAALVRMLAPLGVEAPAVRTAVSRMVRQGWLEPERLAAGAGYALTERAWRRLEEAAGRIYRTHEIGWDGTWHLLVLGQVSNRSSRNRLRAGLRYLGYAPLSDGTWISPHQSAEIDGILAADGVSARRFTASHNGDSATLVAAAWDLDALARNYRRWQAEAERLVADDGAALTDEQAFAIRSRLVHEWRKFLFQDPGLPRQLLPAQWPGDTAAAFFDSQATRLLPAARRFVDACLDADGGTA